MPSAVSDLHETSLSVLRVGAVKSLSYERLLLIVSDSLDFERVDELNNCGVNIMECGVALLIRQTNKEATITLTQKSYPGYSTSVWPLLELLDQAAALGEKEKIIAIEI